MHYFVTGGTGVMGRALINELTSNNHTVTALVRSESSDSAKAIASLGAKLLPGSLSDLEGLKTAAGSSDGVVHLAFDHGPNFVESCQTDANTIKAMGSALAGTNKPIITISGTLSLKQDGTRDESTAVDTDGMMGKFRGPNEQVALDLAPQGVRSSVFRLGPVNHGSTDEKYFLPNLITKAKETGFAAYVEDGNKHRLSATNLADLAIAFRLALEKGKGGVYHPIAESVDVKDIAEKVAQRLGVPAKAIGPQEAMGHYGIIGMVVMQDDVVKSEKTRAELGWAPAHNSVLKDLDAEHYFKA